MSHLYTYGQQDFNKNIEVVEQDLTGDLDVILEKMMKWKQRLNSNQKTKIERTWPDHGMNAFTPFWKMKAFPKKYWKGWFAVNRLEYIVQ